MNYRAIPDRAKARLPTARLQGAVPEWVVAEWQPNVGDAGMWCEIERHFTLNAALADIEMYIKKFPEEPEKKEQQ